MRQSSLFTKTTKQVSKDETSSNAQLLLRAGYIHKEMAGAYAYLPLGWRVMNNIMNVIREEMNVIGGQEVCMTALQDPALWQRSGRWDEKVIDVWFKTLLANGSEVGLGNTHEEPITNMLTQHIRSYRDLPVYVYQFQTKFRNELRAKSGIMRSREFIMKDLYSFSNSEAQHNEFYEQAKQAYTTIFKRLGLGELTYLTFASGGSFSQFSHEFQTLTDSGEDIIYIDEEKKIAINKEVYTDDIIKDLGLDKTTLVERKAIEVGNIFTLGTRFSEPLQLQFTDESGKQQPVFMGCYGIGPGRVMGAIVEVHHDDQGIIWPESVSPFRVHLLNLNKDSVQSDTLYAALQDRGYSVLYDDRSETVGAKFKDADLLGMPHRLVVSERNNGQIEYKARREQAAQLVSETELYNFLDEHVK